MTPVVFQASLCGATRAKRGQSTSFLQHRSQFFVRPRRKTLRLRFSPSLSHPSSVIPTLPRDAPPPARPNPAPAWRHRVDATDSNPFLPPSRLDSLTAPWSPPRSFRQARGESPPRQETDELPGQRLRPIATFVGRIFFHGPLALYNSTREFNTEDQKLGGAGVYAQSTTRLVSTIVANNTLTQTDRLRPLPQAGEEGPRRSPKSKQANVNLSPFFMNSASAPGPICAGSSRKLSSGFNRPTIRVRVRAGRARMSGAA